MFSGFSPAGASWSGVPQKGFWFAVNAELIIYGATEPTARRLRSTANPSPCAATARSRSIYSFPDGQYKLPVVAVSAAGDDKREVQLTFDRQSRTKGEVGKVKQPAQLRSPAAASCAA